MTLDIVIPVYNEERTLEAQLARFADWMRANFRHEMPWTLTLADNGSTDRTAAIADALRARHPWLRYHRVARKGVGLALKEVWDASTADLVGFMDLDLATDLRHLPEAIDAITSGADVAVGSRLAPGAEVRQRKLKREISSRVFNWLLQQYLRVGFSDGMCGFKFVRRDAYRRLRAQGLGCDGWFFSTELLIRAEHAGMTVREIPVLWVDDPDSKAKVIPLARQYIGEMRRLKRELGNANGGAR